MSNTVQERNPTNRENVGFRKALTEPISAEFWLLQLGLEQSVKYQYREALETKWEIIGDK